MKVNLRIKGEVCLDYQILHTLSTCVWISLQDFCVTFTSYFFEKINLTFHSQDPWEIAYTRACFKIPYS